MVLRFFYFFVIAAALTATPARAATDADTAASPVPHVQKGDEPEEPPVESRVQMPDMPQQHPEEKPAVKAPNENHAAAATSEEAYGPVTLGSMLTPAGKLEKGKEAAFTLELHDKDGKVVTEDMLEQRHTRKIHLLAVDESLTDYQHLHPVSDGKGWRFSFTPLTAHNYKIWIDVKRTGEAPQMMPMSLTGAEPCKGSCIDKAAATTADFGNGNKAELHFDGGIKVDMPGRATVSLTSSDGTPLKNLEPVMGAYAHVAAFPGDLSGVVHVHPMGAEPQKDDDRGASPLTFMLHPGKPGLLKLFVQVKVEGKDIFLPFAVTVDAAAPKQESAPKTALEPAPAPAHEH